MLQAVVVEQAAVVVEHWHTLITIQYHPVVLYLSKEVPAQYHHTQEALEQMVLCVSFGQEIPDPSLVPMSQPQVKIW
jgi:hypothetical protein